jgi:hypothetical protein
MGFLKGRKTANIIESKNMIRVGVGQKNGIHALNLSFQNLLSKIGWGIKNKMCFVRLYIQTTPTAAIAGI